MNRQLSGLPMESQLTYAREYRDRFGGKVVLGSSPADPVRVIGLPTLWGMSEEDAEALRELDQRVHEAWLSYGSVEEQAKG